MTTCILVLIKPLLRLIGLDIRNQNNQLPTQEKQKTKQSIAARENPSILQSILPLQVQSRRFLLLTRIEPTTCCRKLSGVLSQRGWSYRLSHTNTFAEGKVIWVHYIPLVKEGSWNETQ
jgi:hypothetical protein